MIITYAKYIKSPDTGENGCINCTINGEKLCVPLVVGNRHYDELMKWVEEGNTIEEAD
jgi:hypothetical protein